MGANRGTQFSRYSACMCSTSQTWTATTTGSVVAAALTFDYAFVNVSLLGSGNKPIWVSVAGVATTNDWYVSTGANVTLALPSVSGSFSITCQSSGAEYTFTLLR